MRPDRARLALDEVTSADRICYHWLGMKEVLEAIYENGVFRPLKDPAGLAEHRRVTLTVSADEPAASLADGVRRISVDDAREMREVVSREFENIDARDWQ